MVSQDDDNVLRSNQFVDPMTRTKKGILLSLLGILEIVFLSLALATYRPRGSAQLAALVRYQHAQTSENRDQWA
jgi:hypothetical protein